MAARGSANALVPVLEGRARAVPAVVPLAVDVTNGLLVVDAMSARLGLVAVMIGVVVMIGARLHAMPVLRLVTRARRAVSSVTSSRGLASSARRRSGRLRMLVKRTMGRVRTVTIATSTA